MTSNRTPAFNLKVVLRETGIAADTLRAWERRYGLPVPSRTPGGHRLYSQHDIDIIKWLMTKQDDGFSISLAVDLWNELTASGEDPLQNLNSKSLAVSQLPAVPGVNLDVVRMEWLQACLDFNESAAEQILNQALAISPLETVCTQVLHRGLNELGEMWYKAKITIQQEHFTSMLAQRKLDTLIAATPPPNQPYTIIVGCPPGEQHTFIPLLLSLFLRRRGLKVIYLGANVPTQRFNETLQSVKPHLVILSAQLLQTASGLRDTAAYLNSNGGRVAYGGRIFNYFPELRKRIPAHFLGESIDDAIQFVDKLLISNTPLNATYPIREEDKLINNKFAQKRSIIDLYALIEAEKIGISKEFASTAINELGNNLSSSLSLGYLDAIQAEIEWIVGLLQEYGHKKPDLVHFITAYSDSIIKAMGTEGQPIADWFIQHMAIVEN